MIWSTGLVLQVDAASIATYKLKVRNDWSQIHHKDWAPSFSSVHQAHFSHLGGGTHNDQLVVWKEGELAGRGMILMQETGWIDHAQAPDLRREFDQHIADGTAYNFINYPRWFWPGTTTEREFEASSTHPLVTLVSMLGPSPDWFVGVSGLNLMEGGGWRSLIEVDLYTYDGGSEAGDDRFSLQGPEQNPQLPITRITDTDGTLLKGSLPIGKFTFELVSVVPEPGSLFLVLVGGCGLMFAARRRTTH